MTKEDIQRQLENGEHDKIIERWRFQRVHVEREALIASIRSKGWTAEIIYEQFLKVGNFIQPLKGDYTKEDEQKILDALKNLIPEDVLTSKKVLDQAIPSYLKSNNVEAVSLFNALWEGLKNMGHDEKTIGIGWVVVTEYTP